MNQISEAAFETVIEAHPLAIGYVSIVGHEFDRDRATFLDMVLAFIRGTQPKEWAKLEALHGDETGEQALGDFWKWIDANSVRTIARIKERCSALIAAAISGKIEMGNAEAVRHTPSPSKPGKRVLP